MLRLRALVRPTSPYQSAVAIMPRSQLHRPPRRHREASRGRKSLSHKRKCHSIQTQLVPFFTKMAEAEGLSVEDQGLGKLKAGRTTVIFEPFVTVAKE